MVHYFYYCFLTSTVFTIGLYSDDIALPPDGVIDLIDSVLPAVKKVFCVHYIVQYGVYFYVGRKVDNFDVDLLKIGSGGWVGVVDVEGVGDVGVEDLGSGLLVLSEDVELVIGVD